MEAFTYSVSRDLRTPLRVMQGFSTALQKDYGDQLDDLAQNYIRYITESAVQMDTLITELLDYSRLSRAEIRLYPVDLAEVVEAALKQLSVQLQECCAEIRVAPLPIVPAYRPILVQIVANLISNAIKFVEAEPPSVQIYASSNQPDQPVRLWVQDNGIGISP